MDIFADTGLEEYVHKPPHETLSELSNASIDQLLELMKATSNAASMLSNQVIHNTPPSLEHQKDMFDFVQWSQSLSTMASLSLVNQEQHIEILETHVPLPIAKQQQLDYDTCLSHVLQTRVHKDPIGRFVWKSDTTTSADELLALVVGVLQHLLDKAKNKQTNIVETTTNTFSLPMSATTHRIENTTPPSHDLAGAEKPRRITDTPWYAKLPVVVSQ
jgi:hypothetical protein